MSDFQVYTPSDYQNILANSIIEKKHFKFQSRSIPNIKKGLLYCFKTYNEHCYNSVWVESFNFFKKGFNSTVQLDKKTQLSLRGYGNLKNKTLVAVLREKIRNALMEVTSKDHFTENCDLVLRFSGISTCSGSESHKNKHGICVSAKNIFEQMKNVEIIPNNNGENVTCLFKNILHSQKEFEKLKVIYNTDDEKYSICNTPMNYDAKEKKYFFNSRENRNFIHNVFPIDCIDENIYSSYTKNLSGLFSLTLTGVYLNDDTTKHDTMTLWCRIESCHLVTDVYEVSDNVFLGLAEEDDILKGEEAEESE